MALLTLGPDSSLLGVWKGAWAGLCILIIYIEDISNISGLYIDAVHALDWD